MTAARVRFPFDLLTTSAYSLAANIHQRILSYIFEIPDCTLRVQMHLLWFTIYKKPVLYKY